MTKSPTDEIVQLEIVQLDAGRTVERVCEALSTEGITAARVAALLGEGFEDRGPGGGLWTSAVRASWASEVTVTSAPASDAPHVVSFEVRAAHAAASLQALRRAFGPGAEERQLHLDAPRRLTWPRTGCSVAVEFGGDAVRTVMVRKD